MFQRLLYRNLRARDDLELFLVAAIASLLLLRFALYLAGYPQVGGGTLHIAHMLWGGALMLASMVLMIGFIGARIQRLAALLGGIGFGIFIDELGKFITKDNNYFFHPTIGIIYAVFISLYLAFNALSRDETLSSREYQLNALLQLEEAILDDLDANEKARIRSLLSRADQHDAITKELLALVKRLDTVPLPKPNRLQRLVHYIENGYRNFWVRRGSNSIVSVVFVIEALLFLIISVVTIAQNIDVVQDAFQQGQTYGQRLLIGQLISSLVAGMFVIYGAIQLPVSRLKAFEQFKRATLINIFLTEFFMFTRVQFRAMPGFIIGIILLLGLRLAINEEHRVAAAN